MVADGREDRQWDAEFFGAAKPYFASIPTFYVIGNHEGGSPLAGKPGARRRPRSLESDGGRGVVHRHRRGPGLDARRAQNLKWLETTLKESREPFIFVCSHYPPWSSGSHGAMHERTSIEARDNILPLMKKYGATAFIAGHDHDYERSEPPDGVTVIVSGGAGRRSIRRCPILGRTPTRRCFECKHHFCLFTIDGNQCTMQALTPEGKLLDSKTWPARVVE